MDGTTDESADLPPGRRVGRRSAPLRSTPAALYRAVGRLARLAPRWREAPPGRAPPSSDREGSSRLIVEKKEGGTGPERVQVKPSTYKSPYGIYEVQICTNGGNQSWNGLVRRFDPEAVEWLFVLTDDLDRYLIPTSAVTSTTTLNLGRRMERFRIGRAQLRLPL